jgi:anti-sigma regulatory factor (Ser/Thr protein kinase)
VKVLVATSDEALLKGLSNGGIELIPAASLEEVCAALEDQEPNFAIFDEQVDFAHDALVEVRADYDGPDRDRLPVVLRTNGGADPARVRCLPDQALETDDAGQLLEAAKAILMRRARQRRLFDQELVLEVPTTPEAVERAGDIFDRLIQSAGYDVEEQVRLNHTFREAVGNAAEHGNKNDPQRTIHVVYLRSPDRITFVIRDEGDGHDTDKFLNRTAEVSALEHTRSRREGEARPGGLGVFIMKQTCDQISFNQIGNSIFLMKYLPGQERS